MFLTGRGGEQGSFRVTLGVALSLFMTSYDQDGELGDVPRSDIAPASGKITKNEKYRSRAPGQGVF